MAASLSYFLLLIVLVFQSSIVPIDGILRKGIFPSPELSNVNLKYVDSEPLFLTPYIESGKLDEGRRASEVTGLPVDVKSYSGFFTVNKTYDSNMFFWFFPAQSGKTDVPVVLWLQGGPGGSSLFGLFVENGPLVVQKDGTVELRKYAWNKDFALLFIDNPVGTGFSFTKDDRGYANNEVDVAENLYSALEQFFTLYSDYKGNPFYLTGESYAGKYLPAIAYKIHKMGQKAKDSGINVQGLAIGDGWCDPRNMFDYGDFLYQMGLIDEKERDHFLEVQKKAQQLVDNGEYTKAGELIDQLLDGGLNTTSYFYNVTGLNFYYNILMDNDPEDFGYYTKFLGLPSTRKSIHVGNLSYDDGSEIVFKHLYDDIMASVKPWIEELLDANYRIAIYSGQLDIIVAAPLSESFLKNLKWNGSKKYLEAPKIIYKVDPNDKVVAGYVRQVENLYQIIIRNAGHILPYDQPRVALDMITRFVNNQPFSN